MFGLGVGPSGSEKRDRNQLLQASEFATGTGMGDITLSSDFMRKILSSDPTQIAAAFAPEISALQTQTQQGKNELAQFGTRSGGTTAAVAGMDAANRAAITNLTGGARMGAANTLGSMGSSLLGMGMSGTESTFGMDKIMHDQSMAQINDLISSIAQTVMGAATGAAGGGGFAGGLGGALGTIGGL